MAFLFAAQADEENFASPDLVPMAIAMPVRTGSAARFGAWTGARIAQSSPGGLKQRSQLCRRAIEASRRRASAQGVGGLSATCW